MHFKNRSQTHTTDLLFTIGLFCVFSAAAFILVMIGIHVYEATVANMQDTYSTRTALSYVTEKVRQHDASDSVRLGELEGGTALVLSDELGGDTFLTYIYAEDDHLCELTVREGTQASRSMGEQIIQVQDFTMEDAGNGFLQFSASDSAGDTIRFLLHLRSGTP